MGCDIHACVERYITEPWPYEGVGVGPARWRFDRALQIDRNYHLFSILAGVRGDHEPIAQPRGLPSDLDRRSVTRAEHVGDAYWDSGNDFGDHSYSWLTLSELRAYDWNVRLIEKGVIPLRGVDRRSAVLDSFYEETYAEWIQSPPHAPKAACGGLSSAEILDLRPREFLVEDLSHIDTWKREEARRVLKRHVNDAEKARRYLADPTLFPEAESPPPGALLRRPGMTHGWFPGKNNPRTAWALIAWSLTAREACQAFCTWLDETKDLPGDATRLVFGFDS